MKAPSSLVPHMLRLASILFELMGRGSDRSAYLHSARHHKGITKQTTILATPHQPEGFHARNVFGLARRAV